MNHASLFSGIGGFDLAAEWMGWTNIFSCEKDDKANLVLQKNFPGITHHRDIFKLDAKKYEGQIDILTGGFPCQPFSLAGKRKGTKDDRHLWPEMLRIIRECKPTYVVGENVFGLTNMDNGKTLESIYIDLESEGYTVESFVIPACAVQAWHRRDRIWIIAYNGIKHGSEKISRREKSKQERAKVRDNTKASSEQQRHGNDSHANGIGQQHSVESRIFERKRKKSDDKSTKGCSKIHGREYNKEIWTTEPNVGRVANGIPKRVDRLKQLGNAIVPQVAYEIFKIIKRYDEQTTIQINNRSLRSR